MDDSTTSIQYQKDMAEVDKIKASDNLDDDVFIESRYGWCGWTPGWLQKINRPRWLLLFLCAYALVQVCKIKINFNVIANYFTQKLIE